VLRAFILGIALVMAVVGLWLLRHGVWTPGGQVLVIAGLVFLGTLFERWRYRKDVAPPGAQWQQTDEKFADPITGEEMQVQYDPVSGERRYVRR
jgi:hypothetical protein